MMTLPHFLEQIMTVAPEEHDGKVNIDDKNITYMQFADDIDTLAEEEQELEVLVDSLDETYTRYKLQISLKRPN